MIKEIINYANNIKDTFELKFRAQNFLDIVLGKIDKLQNEINRLYIEKRCEGNLLMENKHLKDDNVRLVELLCIPRNTV